jgi:hypothetical protein
MKFVSLPKWQRINFSVLISRVVVKHSEMAEANACLRYISNLAIEIKGKEQYCLGKQKQYYLHPSWRVDNKLSMFLINSFNFS